MKIKYHCDLNLCLTTCSYDTEEALIKCMNKCTKIPSNKACETCYYYYDGDTGNGPYDECRLDKITRITKTWSSLNKECWHDRNLAEDNELIEEEYQKRYAYHIETHKY